MKVKKTYLHYLLCLIPFLEMPRISMFDNINKIFLLMKLASAAWVAVYCIATLVKTKKLPISKIGVCLILYEAWIIFSTFLHHGELVSAISDGLAMLIPVLLFDLYIDKIGLRGALYPIIIIYCFYALTTMMQEIMLGLPVEYYNNSEDYSLIFDEYGFIFALGHMKRFIFFLMPMLVFAIMLVTPRNIMHQMGIWLLGLLSFFVLYRTWAVSGMIVVILIMILYTVFNNRFAEKMLNFFNYKLVFIIYLCLNVLLVSGTLLDLLAPVLKLFGKTTTLSGRTIIWEIGIKMIQKSPILGYGVNTEFLQSRLDGLSHFHNLLLNITYTGGIVSLALYLFINYLVAKKLSANSDKWFSVAISIGLYANMILALTDTPDYNMAFVFFVLAHHVDHIYINKSKIKLRLFEKRSMRAKT